MRRLVIPLHPLYCVSSMNEITRRLFQLAVWRTSRLPRWDTGTLYLYQWRRMAVLCPALRTSQMTPGEAKNSVACSKFTYYLLGVVCAGRCTVRGAAIYRMETLARMQCWRGRGGDNPTVASLFWSFFVPFVNRDSHGGHSSSDFLSRDFSGQW